MLKKTVIISGAGLLSVATAIIIGQFFPLIDNSDFIQGFFTGLAIVFLLASAIMMAFERRTKRK